MPSGGIRVDENTLGFAKEADDFLSLASAGLSNRDIPLFWRELSCDPERVQSFVVCLIVKLIALDGGQGKLNLSKNYCEICGLDVDVAGLKTWMSKEKPCDQERKHLSLLLQHQIICTLYFLKQFYPHTPSNHLKNMHVRWSLARNCVRAENNERCDNFEVMVMKDYYRFGAEVPKVINPVNPQLLVDILEACCKRHRRGQLGYLPLRHSKLCNYQEVADSLAYYRLQHVVSGSQSSVCDAITELVSILKRCSIDTADHGEKEILLPVLQLLRQFVMEAVRYSTTDVYRAVQPFYLWPTPHCDVAKSLLDIIQEEDVKGGSAFREKLIAEQHSELSLQASSLSSNATLNQRHYHHVLVDIRAARSYTFSQAFDKQEAKDPISLKKLLLRNIFYSLLRNVDLAKLDEQLEGMTDQLDRLCTKALDIVFSPEEDASGCNGIASLGDNMALVVMELNQLYSEIMSHVSDYPMQEHLRLTPQQLEDFSLPAPYYHTHSIRTTSTGVFKEKLKEIITNLSGKVRRHKKLSGRRTAHSSISQDSGTLDHEYIPSPDDVMSPRPYPVRPLSAPTSRIHSVSEPDDSHNHIETISVPTSPLYHGEPPMSPAVSFSSSQQNLSDDPSASDPSDSASINSNTSTSRSRSQSPTSSENGSYFPQVTHFNHRGSIPGYGTGNRVRAESIGRRMTSPYIDSVTRQGTLVRMQSKNGMNTIRVKRKSIAPIPTVSKVLKIVLAGDDKMVNTVASAYTELRIHEPSLFAGLQIQFFYVPLSEVSTATEASLNSTSHNRKSLDSADHLIQPLVDAAQQSLYGEDVWLGCFIGNMDSWYERNVLLATHNLLRIIPSPEKASHLTPPLGTHPILSKLNENKVSPSPAQLLRSLVTNYCREAQNMIRFNMYSIELEVKPDKASSKHRTHQQESNVAKCHYMLQRVDVQRCVKGHKHVKMFEAKLTIEEVTLDCTRLKERTFSLKNIWSVGVSSVPRIYDLHANNPEHDNMELMVTQATTEGRVTSSHKLSEENSYHVKSVELEAKEKPFSVMINGDPSCMIENVTRVTIRPAMAGEKESNSLISSLSLDEHRSQKQVYFPLMSFWPVDL